MKPIVVYLDTADFGAMYNAENDSPSAGVRRKLLNFVEGDKIIVAITFVHFFEFIQKASAEYQADRRNRIRFMDDLSRGWSFPYFWTLQMNRRPF